MNLQPIKKIYRIVYGISSPSPYVISVRYPYEEGKICDIEKTDEAFYEKYGREEFWIYKWINGQKDLWKQMKKLPDDVTFFSMDENQEYLLIPD